jgi:hypothetical protein
MTARAFQTGYERKFQSGLGGNRRNGYGRYPDPAPRTPLTPQEILELRRKQRGQS